MTRLFGVVGDPVAHSLSPLIHNSWLKADQIDASYTAFHVPTGHFREGMEDLAGRHVCGVNVTLPHKQEALRLANSCSEAASMIGAANLLVRQDTGWVADNTDAPGFALSLEQLQIPLKDLNVFLLGAGGSARAVAHVMHQLGSGLTICNRTISKAEELARHLAPGCEVLALEEGLVRLHEADLVINTLSLGQSGGGFCLPETRSGIFYDISYGKGAAAALSEAGLKGWRTQDGLFMLVAQAALSYQAWFGKMPELAGAYSICRQMIGQGQ